MRGIIPISLSFTSHLNLCVEKFLWFCWFSVENFLITICSGPFTLGYLRVAKVRLGFSTDVGQTNRNISTPSLQIVGGRQSKWNNSFFNFSFLFTNFYVWYDIWSRFVISPFSLMPVLGIVEGCDYWRKMDRPKGIFRRLPFVALMADKPNWRIRWTGTFRRPPTFKRTEVTFVNRIILRRSFFKIYRFRSKPDSNLYYPWPLMFS